MLKKYETSRRKSKMTPEENVPVSTEKKYIWYDSKA